MQSTCSTFTAHQGTIANTTNTTAKYRLYNTIDYLLNINKLKISSHKLQP